MFINLRYFLKNRRFLRNPGQHNSDQQTVRLNKERFTIPEIIFYPSDVGIQQMGVSEAVLNCIEACPTKSHHILLANIIVMSGCSLFPGMRDRLETEIRCLAADDMEVGVSIAEKYEIKQRTLFFNNKLNILVH